MRAAGAAAACGARPPEPVSTGVPIHGWLSSLGSVLKYAGSCAEMHLTCAQLNAP
eukprot:SAG31_NODE_872_length_11329_cov_3.968655_6_plen_55_part_00